MVITFSSFVYGQDESLFNRINGVKLKENIFIKWDEPKKTFVYASDGIDSWHTRLIEFNYDIWRFDYH